MEVNNTNHYEYVLKALTKYGIPAQNTTPDDKKIRHDGSKSGNKSGRLSRNIKKSKHPFSSTSKNKNQRNKKINSDSRTNSSATFGVKLSEVATCCVYQESGGNLTVPQVLVDTCNVIRANLSIEGIFRKAGSANRQSDLKKILDQGQQLPDHCHPVDAACLIKQFIRCLPDPLLPTEVHNIMMRCLELPSPDREETLILSTLLLPERNLHLVLYLMRFFNDVSLEKSNLMSSHNLSIVLAPNILPMNIETSKSRPSLGEDVMLAANIDIIKTLIDHADQLYKASIEIKQITDEITTKPVSKDLLSPNVATPHVKKKRRSASLHRLVTGLKRVVGHSPLSASSDRLDIIGKSEPTRMTPAKRKSDGWQVEHSTFDIGETDHIIKKPRIEQTESSPPPNLNKSSVFNRKTKSSKKKTRKSLPSNTGSRFFVHEDKLSDSLKSGLSNQREIPSHLQSSLKIPTLSLLTQPLVRRSASTVYSSNNIQTPIIKKSISSTSKKITINTPTKNVLSFTPTKKIPSGTPSMMDRIRQPPRRKSYDCSFVPHNRDSDTPCRLRHRSSYGNNPDGTETPELGPRGIPDGAESNFRDKTCAPVVKNGSCQDIHDDIEQLEEQYMITKSAVIELEQRVDENLSDFSSTSKDLNYSQMIQNAYEKIRNETNGTEYSPNEVLERRLGQELKLKKRRSGENRVIRSPSERRIGVIRRRSRELQNDPLLTKSTRRRSRDLKSSPEGSRVHMKRRSLDSESNRVELEVLKCRDYMRSPGISHEFSNSVSINTPRIKSALLQTPLTVQLRRGKPNSVKSGLPLMGKHCETIAKPHFSTPKSSQFSNDQLALYDPPESHEVSISYSSGRKAKKTRSLSPRRLSVNKSNFDHSHSFDGSFTEIATSEIPSTPNNFRGELNMVSKLDFNDEDCSDSVDSNDNVKQLNVPQITINSPQWQQAAEFIEKDEFKSNKINEGSRPSIAALKRRKKVTENVQLFNKLNTSPGQRGPRPSINFSQMTPHERLRAKQRSRHQYSTKIAIVSPLKETNQMIKQTKISSPLKSDVKSPPPPPLPLKGEIFKTPRLSARPPRTPHTLKVASKTAIAHPRLSLDVAPKVPPRTPIRPSPLSSKFR